MDTFQNYRIAAIVPCHNEEAGVAKVVTDLRNSVAGMTVYVYDNQSSDRTSILAAEAGAIVRAESFRGKGNVVRRAFADIDADIYLLIDGDDTYDASAAPQMIEALLSGPYDHVLGVRQPAAGAAAPYRPAHQFGNRFLNRIVAALFGVNVVDMLSGYRVFSRRFVKSFPAVSREFEIETELTIHYVALRIPSTSVIVGFRDRAEGSVSKLRTYRDGAKILRLILNLTRRERPGAFYGVLGVLALFVAVILAIPVFLDYLRTGLVPRFPTLLVAVAIAGISSVAGVAGLVLDGIRQSRHEFSRLVYLSHPAVVSNAWPSPAGVPRPGAETEAAAPSNME
jgi:glycosyltransferase involved in cell wall biosynthesis